MKSSPRSLVSYTFDGFAPARKKSRAAAGNPLFDLLLAQGFLSVDQQMLESTSEPKRRRRITVELPPHKSKTFLAQLIHPNGGITWHVERKRRSKTSTRTIELSFPSTTMKRGISAGGVFTLVIYALSAAAKTLKKSIGTIAQKWEDKRTPHSLYRMTEKGTDWENPLRSIPHHNGKRGLLLIHGFFSSTDEAFRPFFERAGRPFFKTLLDMYDNRIIGFDHPSISRSPIENAQWLVEHTQKRSLSRYDILASSRGGLVARSLVELKNKLGPRAGHLSIDRVVLVGCPNRGTPLAGPSPYSAVIHWLGNVIPSLAGVALPRALEYFVYLLKILTWGIPEILPGVESLKPGSAFLKELNRSTRLGGPLYYAIGANFDAPKKLLLKLVDAGVDAVFGDEENDLMVPAAGCIEADRRIPDERSALFAPLAADASLQTNIHHFGYFSSLVVQRRIAEYLGVPRESNTQVIKLREKRVRNTIDRRNRFVEEDPERAITVKGRVKDLLDLPESDFQRLVIDDPTLVRDAVRDVVSDLAPVPTPSMPKKQPVFKAAMPHLDMAIIGNPRAERDYRRWTRRWKRAIAKAQITRLPPEPFPLLMATAGLARVVKQFKTKGEDTYWHSLIGTERSLRRYLEDAGPELSLARLENAGDMLYKTIFPRDVERMLDRAAAHASGRSPVLVTFTTTNPWIADFPWEMVFDNRKGRFLSLGDICFFRGVISTRAAMTLPAVPMVIRMLVAIAQPKDQTPLNVEQEVKGLKEALAPLVERRRLFIDVLEHTTPQSLKAKLERTRYHVLHYIGHGDYDEEEDIGTLIFESDKKRTSVSVDADAFCTLVTSHAPHMRLVVLNGCETADGGKADFNRGVAPALVAAGLPAVVGNRLIVGDEAAVRFSTAFYWELNERKSFAEAMMTARRTLATGFEPHAWSVPIIFAIDPEAPLF